jgi:hypothetical protein
VPGTALSRYGYVYTPDPAGHKGTVTINPDDAAVVEMIYRWYTAGDDNGGTPDGTRG